MDDQNQINVFVAPVKAEDFPLGENQILNKDDKGRQKAYVLLGDGRIAVVREGKGADVERANMESQGNQSKYLSSMMAATVKIAEKSITMYDLGDLSLKDYMRIQVAFAEINF